MTTLGIAVIGQAPRPDILATYARMLPPDTRIVMRGCLDDLDRNAIDEVRPENDADALYTQLPDGAEVTIAKRVVTARAATTLRRLRAGHLHVPARTPAVRRASRTPCRTP